MSDRARRSRRDGAELEVIRGGEWIDPAPLGDQEPLDPTDVFGPPIDEGEYDASFIGQERAEGLFQNRVAKWLVTMKIEGGPHAERHLLFAIPCLKRGRPRPSFKFLAALRFHLPRSKVVPRDLRICYWPRLLKTPSHRRGPARGARDPFPPLASDPTPTG